VIDEDLTQTCGVSDVGECTFGTETCSAGSWVGCTAIFPKPEEPNGKDDDCDGIIDNDFQCLPGQTNSRECGYNNIGICKMGLETQVCSPLGLWGSWGTCIGAIYPREEVYNGLDDDCNGIIDDVKREASFENSLIFTRINILPEPGKLLITPGSNALVQVFVENQGTKTFEDVSVSSELIDYGSRTRKSKNTIKKGEMAFYNLILPVPWHTKSGYTFVKIVLSSEEGMRIKYVPVKIN
jgi:hypothetical protein